MIPRLHTFAILLTMGMMSPVFAERKPIGEMESSYRIGQGDTVEIVVWAGQKKEESLSGQYFVFASGVIEMPLIGSFDVSGQTLEEATVSLQTFWRHSSYEILM